MRKKTAIETVRFVHARLDELAQMSREAGFDELAYLIEVAALEAESDCRAPQRKNGIGKSAQKAPFN